MPEVTEITVTVNDESLALRAGLSLADCLAEQGLEAARLVAEVNGAIVPREAFASTILKDRDSIEVIHFVGGG